MSTENVSSSSSGVSSDVSSDDDNDTSSEASAGTVDTRNTSSLSVSWEEDSQSSSTRYNIENCTDFHVGPKLFAENFQINLSGEHNLIDKVTEKLMGQVNSGPSDGNVLTPIKTKWRVRKVHFYSLGLIIWLSIVTCVVFVVLREERVQGSHSDSDTTPRQSVTTPQLPPDTHQTTTPQIVTTPSPTTNQRPTTISTSEPTQQTEPTIPFHFVSLVSRDSWRGLEPPQNAARNRTVVRSVIVDNLKCDRCSGQVNCSKILRSLENKTQTALNYNFLIDDSGIVYEARGWHYAADEQTPFSVDLIKFGFIGSYEDSHLTNEQKVALSQFISQYWVDFNATPLVKAQCCRDIESEKGPDVNISCDLLESELFLVDTECLSEVKNCDNRSWFWKYFSSNTLHCDQRYMFNYISHLI